MDTSAFGVPDSRISKVAGDKRKTKYVAAGVAGHTVGSAGGYSAAHAAKAGFNGRVLASRAGAIGGTVAGVELYRRHRVKRGMSPEADGG